MELQTKRLILRGEQLKDSVHTRFRVFLSSTDEHIGDFYLHTTGHIHYCIDEPHQGKGYCHEALKAISDCVCSFPIKPRLTIHRQNLKSQSCALKAGYVRTGVCDIYEYGNNL